LPDLLSTSLTKGSLQAGTQLPAVGANRRPPQSHAGRCSIKSLATVTIHQNFRSPTKFWTQLSCFQGIITSGHQQESRSQKSKTRRSSGGLAVRVLPMTGEHLDLHSQITTPSPCLQSISGDEHWTAASFK
jgi:hypothetical protein